jgi:hypothetical protein
VGTGVAQHAGQPLFEVRPGETQQLAEAGAVSVSPSTSMLPLRMASAAPPVSRRGSASSEPVITVSGSST